MNTHASPWRRVAIAGVAITTIALAGCSGSGDSGGGDDSGPVTLTFNAWVPGEEAAVDLWNEQNPDIQVEFTRIASADAKNLPSLIDAGTAPDIAQISAAALPSYVIDERVQDLSDYIGGDEDKYIASQWAGVQLGDGVWAVPQDSAPNALMYRKDIFEQYGIAVPTTWDEYVEAGKKLQAANPEVFIGQFSANELGFWQAASLQADNSWFGTDGDAWTVDIDDADVQPVAELQQQMLDEKILKVEEMWTPEYWADVNAGKIASLNYAAWFPVILAENAPDLAGKWAIAPSPSVDGDGTSSDLGGSVNIVTKDAKNAEAAAKFLTWLNTDPESLEILIGQGGIFPAATAGFDSEALNAPNEYFGGENISTTFIDAANNSTTATVAGPGYADAYAAMMDEFATVVTGEQTVAEALANVDATTTDAVKAQGLTVK